MAYPDKTVLVVDDTSLHRAMLVDMLQDMGIGTVLEARDGLEGMRMARFHKPDLVLLDLTMPVLDGFEACEKIRMFASPLSMPIIVITGHERKDVLQRIFDLGANDYFEKPFILPEIAMRVRFYLNLGDILSRSKQFEAIMKRDLIVARAIQQNSLPTWTRVAEYLSSIKLDLGAVYQACTGLGGDSWAMEIMDNGDPCFFLFDVSGHGINAAINNSYIISLQQSIFNQFRHVPVASFTARDILEKLNRALYDHLQEGTFCAAACFKVDSATGLVDYAGCGLPDFRLIERGSSKLTFLPVRGIPLGIVNDDFQPTVGRFNLTEKSVFVAMTDGLIESMTPNHKLDVAQYGTYLPGERLFNMCLQRYANAPLALPALSMLQQIVEEFRSNDYDLSTDDITVLMLQRFAPATSS